MNYFRGVIALSVTLILTSSCRTRLSVSRDQQVDATFTSRGTEDGAAFAVKEMAAVIQEFPEARQPFLDWDPASEQGNAFKIDVAQELLALGNPPIERKKIEAITSKSLTPGARAKSYRPIDLHVDQGPHRTFLSEWWYYTGHLTSDAGQKLGFELCFFRVAPVGYFAHMALTDETGKTFRYRRRVYSPLAVTMDPSRLDLRYGDAGARQTENELIHHIWTSFDDVSFSLQLTSKKFPLIINGNGVIDMPEGTDSLYYSLTRMETTGTVTVGGRVMRVTGMSWMDHQWGNFIARRTGWDWFSIQMNDGRDYNLFSFRSGQDKALNQYVNSLDAQGRASMGRQIKIERLSWWRSPVTKQLYVTKWRIKLPETGEEFLMEATIPNQELVPQETFDLAPLYWEGSMRVTQTNGVGDAVRGLGYAEHFPYRSQVP